MIKTAAVMNAPTPASMPIAPALAAINAAPGVDQAVMMGNRWVRDKTAVVTAIEKHSAVIQDAVWPGVAPSAAAADNTMAIDPPQPTTAAITPESNADNGINRSPPEVTTLHN